MDCKYIGIGAMPRKYWDAWWLPHFAEDFKKAADTIRDSGKLLMYHNHHLEFERYQGKRILEQLTDAFAPDELGFTLDTYWVQEAGADVVSVINELAGRVPCVHLKDMAVVNHQKVMAPVLAGNMPFPQILDALQKANCEHLLVEQDSCIGSPFDALETSYQNLAKLGYR